MHVRNEKRYRSSDEEQDYPAEEVADAFEDGKQCDFTGALDLYTVGSEQRMIGNYMFTCEEADCKIVGFENHSGKTYLGSGGFRFPPESLEPTKKTAPVFLDLSREI